MKSRLRVLLWPVVFATILVIGVVLFNYGFYYASLANLPVCPHCGPGSHVQLWCYGLVVDDTFPRTGPYGGCLITENSPNCGADWGHVRR
jgi:hypothetical protein